jgi:hypothetical protein
MDPNFKRIHYVRYVGDFLIGVVGTYREAKMVKTQLSDFLNQVLEIKLNLNKSHIIHRKKKIPFQGYTINAHKIEYKTKRGITNKETLTLYMDVNKIIKRLSDGKFCTRNGDPRLFFRYLHRSQFLTNTRIRQVLIGLNYYYLLANNRRKGIRRILYILRLSVAMMYGSKFKLRTKGRVWGIKR